MAAFGQKRTFPMRQNTVEAHAYTTFFRGNNNLVLTNLMCASIIVRSSTNATRLYEHGASPECIGAYWRQFHCWLQAGISCEIPRLAVPGWAAPGTPKIHHPIIHITSYCAIMHPLYLDLETTTF